MRITRNYRNSLMNPKKKESDSAADSLMQSLLGRSASGKRTSRLASLLGNQGAGKTDDIVSRNFYSSAKMPQKFYYDMKYHAGQVEESGQALQSKEKDSLYDKAKESGSTGQIVDEIKRFVEQYNNMLNDLKESGSRADNSSLIQLNNMSRTAERELASTGVERTADGKLVIDEKKLSAATVDELKKVWGGSGFPAKAAARAGTIEATAAQNIEAEKSGVYNPLARENLYGYRGGSGSRFNSRS